jgi:hypothetical protein
MGPRASWPAADHGYGKSHVSSACSILHLWGTDEVSVRMREILKVVFSSTLKEPLIWKNAHLNS